jgi:heme exporter protein CcmD
MSLGPYLSFIVTSYLAAALVALLVAWIVTDYCNQKRRLSDLEDSGVVRRSGRNATEP